MTMQESSSTSASSRRRQRSAERTNINLLRYVLDHPGATCKGASEDLAMSLPNVFRLVAGFRDAGLIVGRHQEQTGKRGPWSQVISLRSSLGSTVGVDVEATHIRGVVLDFANHVTSELRQPISPTATPEEIVASVAEVAAALEFGGSNPWMLNQVQHDGGPMRHAELDSASTDSGRGTPKAVGLGLPGPVNDVGRGRVRTELQFGKATLEFVPAVEARCGLPVTAAGNSYCFTAGHHRMHNPRGAGIEMVILNRFGLAAALVWNGQLYTGASHYAGDLGLLPYEAGLRYRDVCTGASLLKLARSNGDGRSFHDLIVSPDDPLVREWLEKAIPAFIMTICNAVVAYNPDSVLIEGMLNKFPGETKRRILDGVVEEINRVGNMLPEISFFEGDDLMGARGAALLARDSIADEVLARIINEG